MPSDSTLDSAPEDASQHPAAEPFEALLAPSLDAPQAGALDQSGYGGLAAPMDTLDLDACVVPPLDDSVLNSGSVADVVDTASFVSGISDLLEPLAYLGTMVGEFTERASFGLAPAIAGLDLLVPRRFNEQEQAVLRVCAENHPMPWTMAPTLVQQDEAQGEHNRRKLKRVAKEWRRHEINRRELP
ncbi:hypothetical protein AB0N97_17800 [Streptomyces collinus]|uniref:hypothetical protein n=1 Tax=Streptomyces collinus TaxID=42684 RepID=UPI00343091BC